MNSSRPKDDEVLVRVNFAFEEEVVDLFSTPSFDGLSITVSQDASQTRSLPGEIIAVLIDLGPAASTILLGAAGSAAWEGFRTALTRVASRGRSDTVLVVAVRHRSEGQEFTYRLRVAGSSEQVHEALKAGFQAEKILAASAAHDDTSASLDRN